jgi:uncharacterized protein YcbX
MVPLQLTALNIYPIKSTTGIQLRAAQVTWQGLQHDRRWMIVDQQGKFMTQRKFPQMALITVQVGEDHLKITAPNQSPLALPLTPTSGAPLAVEIWGDRCQALSMGIDAQTWFSEFLQVPCQLVFMPESTHRPTDHGKLGNNQLVSFADAYPFLLISEASLADLNTRLEYPIPMNRFRPNLVVQGCDAFAEDTWQTIRIGEITFTVAKSCARCSIPGVDQTTGIASKEPLLTLAKYRLTNGEIWFGQNLVHHNLGRLQIGDSIEILERKDKDRNPL